MFKFLVEWNRLARFDQQPARKADVASRRTTRPGSRAIIGKAGLSLLDAVVRYAHYKAKKLLTTRELTKVLSPVRRDLSGAS